MQNSSMVMSVKVAKWRNGYDRSHQLCSTAFRTHFMCFSMPHPEEIDAPLDSALCAECIAEDYLSDEVRRDGTPAMCSYCETRGQTISLEDLASRLETAFAEHYIRTSRFPEWWQERLQADKESDYEWNRSGTPVLDVIEMAACIPRDAAQDVLDILSNRHALWGKDSIGEEAEFDGESYYEELPMSSDSWREAWNEFERALKCQTRFSVTVPPSTSQKSSGGLISSRLGAAALWLWLQGREGV